MVAPGFSPIFRKNCIANGLLPAVLERATVEALARWVEPDPQTNRLTIDLVERSIVSPNADHRFDIADAERRRLLEGLDPIGFTETRRADIDAFEAARYRAHPWASLARRSENEPQ